LRNVENLVGEHAVVHPHACEVVLQRGSGIMGIIFAIISLIKLILLEIY
jgi:hypothetical protein